MIPQIIFMISLFRKLADRVSSNITVSYKHKLPSFDLGAAGQSSRSLLLLWWPKSIPLPGMSN